MDNDGWTTQRRRRSKRINEVPDHPLDQAWMDRNCPPFTGSATEYDQDHYNRYGRAEGMVDGKHVNNDGALDTEPRFPWRSRREEAHKGYKENTAARKKAFLEYDSTVKRHTAQFKKMTDVEKKNYYMDVTGGFLPSQHEELATRAGSWDEYAYKNADGRLRAMVDDPTGYHSLESLNEHREHASCALDEHDRAHEKRLFHVKYRSNQKADKRRDCYDEPVPSQFKAHSRSRNCELPPEGTYSAYHRTPSPDNDHKSVSKPDKIDWWEKN